MVDHDTQLVAGEWLPALEGLGEDEREAMSKLMQASVHTSNLDVRDAQQHVPLPGAGEDAEVAETGVQFESRETRRPYSWAVEVAQCVGFIAAGQRGRVSWQGPRERDAAALRCGEPQLAGLVSVQGRAVRCKLLGLLDACASCACAAPALPPSPHPPCVPATPAWAAQVLQAREWVQRELQAVFQPLLRAHEQVGR